DALMRFPESCRKLKFREADICNRLRFGCQRAAKLASSGVAMGVKDPRAAVRCLARECELRAVAIELSAPVDELLDALRSFFDEHLGGCGVDQSIAGIDRVLQM